MPCWTRALSLTPPCLWPPACSLVSWARGRGAAAALRSGLPRPCLALAALGSSLPGTAPCTAAASAALTCAPAAHGLPPRVPLTPLPPWLETARADGAQLEFQAGASLLIHNQLCSEVLYKELYLPPFELQREPGGRLGGGGVMPHRGKQPCCSRQPSACPAPMHRPPPRPAPRRPQLGAAGAAGLPDPGARPEVCGVWPLHLLHLPARAPRAARRAARPQVRRREGSAGGCITAGPALPVGMDVAMRMARGRLYPSHLDLPTLPAACWWRRHALARTSCLRGRPA